MSDRHGAVARGFRSSSGRSAIQHDALFKPKSIEIIGAPDKPTIGHRLITSLDRIGFADSIPVNPNYSTMLGRRCWPSSRKGPGTGAFFVRASMALSKYRKHQVRLAGD